MQGILNNRPLGTSTPLMHVNAATEFLVAHLCRGYICRSVGETERQLLGKDAFPGALTAGDHNNSCHVGNFSQS